jgi:hypothetical protein
MNIGLPALVVAFAALCVWLTVRIVNRRERWAKRLTVFLVVLASYPGAYLALVRKAYQPTGVDPVTQQNRYEVLPAYRVSGQSAEVFFAPAHQMDRSMRNDFWNTIEHSSGKKWKNPAGVSADASARN